MEEMYLQIWSQKKQLNKFGIKSNFDETIRDILLDYKDLISKKRKSP